MTTDTPFGSTTLLGSAFQFGRGPVIQGAVTTAAPSYTTGTNNPVSLDTSGGLRTLLTASEAHIGSIGGTTGQVTATYARPASAGPYAAGQIIANSATAGSVVPITFTVARVAGGSGRITGGRCVVTAASGTIVLPAFDLVLFRPATNIPFAAGGYPADNATLTISSAAYIECVGVITFSVSAWRNATGGATASGATIWQAASFTARPYAPFNLASLSASTLLGVLQAQNAWAPGAVINTFDFVLDTDQD